MLKQIVKNILLSLLILLVIPVFCYGFSIDLQLSTTLAKVGDNIGISGQADPNSWISTKVLDEGQSIIYFNAVKSNELGIYNDSFIIPDNTEGCLTVVAGTGANVASQTLLVGTLSTQATLDLSAYEGVAGDIITASGSADPGSWVAIKAVDEGGSILFFDAIKASDDGTYSMDLVIPEMTAGNVVVIAGYGDNTASKTLIIGTLSTQVSLELSAYEAVVGDSIEAYGTADPGSWVAVKAVDQGGSILFFDAVKADVNGDYSMYLVIPEVTGGNLSIIAGSGDNTASRTLIIGILSTQVTLELSDYEGVAGDSIRAFGSADPDSWVAIKAVDEEGAILYFDAVKADANGSYSMDLVIPEVTGGNISIIAGSGDNIATQNLTIKQGVDECFIATAAFGSKYEPAVALLRAFRDKYLLSNGLGQALVELYYRNSPPIANYIAGSELLKLLVRIVLTPFIIFAYLLFHPLWMGIIIGLGLIFWIQQRNKFWQLKGY